MIFKIRDDIIIKGNQALLELAMINLITNALKYSGTQEPVLVQVSQSKLEKNQVIIDVIDYGSGIDKKHHSRIFERFYRIDSARSRELGGTGLGLAIVKHIAQVHGGFVTLESQFNQGSKFSIYLPNINS